MPYMHRLRLVVVAAVWMFAAGPARAQVEPISQPPAEVWLNHTLKQQRRLDNFGRYVAAPSSVALGGAAAIFPVLLDTSVASSIAYVGSAAFMLTSAITLWANEDPYEARRQYALWSSLGVSSFGVGLALSCVTSDEACARTAAGRRLQIGLAAFEARLFIANAMLMLFMPPPSATELELSVRNLSPSERHARVLDFLERIDRQRRVASYITAPWGMAFGAHMLVEGFGADDTRGKALLISAGVSVVAFNLITLLYEQLRKGDADRLRAGEYP